MEGNIPVPKSKRDSGLNIVGERNEFKNTCARKMARKDSSSVKVYQKIFTFYHIGQKFYIEKVTDKSEKSQMGHF